nr:MAG TPA: hypothetical protein [Bacteriophage sp.]
MMVFSFTTTGVYRIKFFSRILVILIVNIVGTSSITLYKEFCIRIF